LALAACSPSNPSTAGASPADPGAAQELRLDLPEPAVGSIAWAASGSWRPAAEKARDAWRHPVETLAFFGLQPTMKVAELYPGQGWYSAILAPYLAKGGGALTAVMFDPAAATEAQNALMTEYRARFAADAKLYGVISEGALSANGPPFAAPDSLDMVLIMRNMHTLMGEGIAEKTLRDVFVALKPGGVLGIEQHRAKSSGLQKAEASDGYMQEVVVRTLAEEAGFVFEAASEVNANPKDTKDHPFGVWTLPPVLRTSPLGAAPDPTFDTRPYQAIGESDRMTMRFRKPGGETKVQPTVLIPGERS
jgi:predicted methyltransferase